jgi:hypothetical protein
MAVSHPVVDVEGAMERKTRATGLLMPARRLGGWAVWAVVLTGCVGSPEPGETGSEMDAASDSAMGVGLDATSRDATVHPRDAGKDATLDVEPGSDATSDDGSTDGLSTSDAQVDAGSDVTGVSDAGEAGTEESGTLDSSTQVDTGAPDVATEATTTDGALSDVNAPTDAADDGVVTDAQNVDSGVPSCLVPGTYAIPVTGTNCACVGDELETGPTSFDLGLTIVDDPVAGWELTLTGRDLSLLPPPAPLPIVFTATGFAVDELDSVIGPGALETISLSVDCVTGIATFSGDYNVSTTNDCATLCPFLLETNNSVSGTCSNCL